MKAPQVLVIGAGIGGMSAAIHLARSGLGVHVLEKNPHAGGRCDRFIQDGHHFDSGPTLLVMPQLYEAELSTMGTSLDELVEIQQVDPTYHLVFDDGNQLALTGDPERMRSQLENFETGSHQGFLRYLKEGENHYKLALDRLVKRDFRHPLDFFSLANIPLLYRLKPLVPHYFNMGRYFKNPRLKAAFTFQDVYMGLSPFEAPATFSMMPYTELAHGVWYPKGGMYSIVEGLENVARGVGVEFVFDIAVEQIVTVDERVRGVLLENGDFLEAKVILANADLPYVYQNLLPLDGSAKRMENKRFSCSVVSFFWGVDKVYEKLNAHTLFLADDYRENFRSIIDELSIPDNPSLYIHAPGRLDKNMAPSNEDTIIAIVPVGHLDKNGNQDWVKIRDNARQKVFRRLLSLGIEDLEAHIKFEVNYSPPSWKKRYNLVKGSTHGLCHNLTQLGYFRPPNRHSRYHNLYFTGASTHPGTGVPTALVSGRLAARRIIDDLRLDRNTPDHN